MFNLIKNNNYLNYNVRTMSTKAKFNPKKYLLGNNENLIGTIIAIRKGLVKSKYLEYELDSRDVKDIKDAPKVYSPEAYSILLYFDHRAARIVRFLFNPNLIFWNRKPNLYNFYNNTSQKLGEDETVTTIAEVKDVKSYDKYEYKDYDISKEDIVYTKENKPAYFYNQIEVDPNDKYIVPNVIIDNSKYNKSEDQYVLARHFKLLFDGKISNRMVNLFIYQLTVDYLNNLNHYENCDMEYIYENYVSTKSSTEKLDIEPIIQYPESNKVIYIPKSISVTQNHVDHNMKYHDISFEQKGIVDLPPVINDLRSFINPSLIQNKKYLINRIERFNNSLAKKLAKLN